MICYAVATCIMYGVRCARCASPISLSRYEFLIKNNSRIFRIQDGERVYGRAVAHRITIAENIWFIIHMRANEGEGKEGNRVSREIYLPFFSLLFVFIEFSELLTSFFIFFHCCHNSYDALLLSTRHTHTCTNFCRRRREVNVAFSVIFFLLLVVVHSGCVPENRINVRHICISCACFSTSRTQCKQDRLTLDLNLLFFIFFCVRLLFKENIWRRFWRIFHRVQFSTRTRDMCLCVCGVCFFVGGVPAKLMMMNINIVHRTVRFWYCLLRATTHTRTHKNTKPFSANLWHSFEPTTKVFESVTGDSSNITFRLGAIRAFRVIIPSECVIAARKIHKVDEHIHWFIGGAGADARILVGYAFLPKSSIVLCAWRTALVCRCRRSSIVFLPSIFLLLVFRPADGTSWK